MSDNNPFVLPKKEYKRDINVLKHYVQDTATYLAQMTGRPLNECLSFVRDQVRPGGQFEFKDPQIVYMERGENGDREKKLGKLSVYLNEAIREKELIAPTLTTYIPASKKKSLLVDFIDGNVKARGVAKKAMFKAKMEGDKFMEVFKKNEQQGKKLNNNAISGAHVSASTPLYNKTAHSTLTSNCRSTSGYGNANNEKFLCGNRHYWSPDIVRNNIISIINHTDYDAMEAAMHEYGIRHPSVEETMECINYSVALYWRGSDQIQKLRTLIESLTDLQRSAFVYTGDLYHLMKYNEEVVRRFITRLSMRVDAIHPNPSEIVDKAPEDHRNLASQICMRELKGKTVRDIVNTPAYGIYASTVENIGKVLSDYRTLIRAFWVTENVPASVAHFPDSIRRAALTSDTDSTIFTVQDWVVWHQGKLGFDEPSMAVAATMIFLASQSITHVLARMSANFGIEESRLHQIAMKNEFKFDVFVPTQVAKHYYAIISCQEGNLYEEYDKEIKGVHLKSSNAPKAIMGEAKKMMEFIMMSVVEEKKISIEYILSWVGRIERDVIDSIKRGSFEYFRRGQIKTPASYVDGENAAAYQQYLLWNEVFAKKYGKITSPPYTSIKISADLDSPARTLAWINSLEDKDIAQRIADWLKRSNRKHVGSTFMLPEPCISSSGIPEEILSAIDVRKIVLDTTKVFYLILETLGIYMLNGKTTRLVSDHH